MKPPDPPNQSANNLPEPTNNSNEQSEKPTGASSHLTPRQAFLLRHRWLTFLLPFVVFMAITTLEPTPNSPEKEILGQTVSYSSYPLIYTLKIALTLAAIAFVLPGYREFPLRVSPVAGTLVGIVGVFVWIGACRLNFESSFLAPALENLQLSWLLPTETRSAFNPFEHLSDLPILAFAFMGVRFLGLVVVVPVMEEFFLRGFVMRFVMTAQWWKVPFGKVTLPAVLAGTLVPMLSHPHELLAAALWFSMVTLLMVKTRNIWDCVLAHAVTNGLLGVYVITSGDWHLL